MTVIQQNNNNNNKDKDILPIESQNIDISSDNTDKDKSFKRLEDGSFLIDVSENQSGLEDIYVPSKEELDNHYRNLVDELNAEELQEIADMVINATEEDDAARSEWLSMIKNGLDLLGLKIEEKNKPFKGACSAHHPLIMESAVKFQSKASTELLPAKGPVKTQVLGTATVEREKQALRVKKYLNYQLTEVMTEFYPDSERMLLAVPIVGNGFKKVYYSSALKRPVSEFVPAEQFIVPNNAPDLRRAERFTHVLYRTKNQLEQDFATGFYKKPESGLGQPSEPMMHDVQKKTSEMIGIEIGFGENDQVYTLYEQYVDYCLDIDDKYDGEYEVAYPYIITVDANSRQVLGIRRNWKPYDDDTRKKQIPFSQYSFVPGFGFYSYGLLHLLGNLQISLTAAIRSLVDSGQFANLQGGFKLKGVRIADDDAPIYPGQFKEIEAAQQDIKKALFPLPFKEPSQVLLQMVEFLDRKGQKFADSTEQVIADSTNYGPVGTTLALLDASTKFFSAIHKRLHMAQKNELRLISEINSEILDDAEEELLYNIGNDDVAVTKKDFDRHVDVIPASDPNIPSSSHRMTKAQTILEIALKTPDVHDMREVLKHVYVNMDYDNVDKILPKPEEAKPQDPLTDIQSAVMGQPIKAFTGQEHEAHIQIKMAFMQDPTTGGSQLMQKARMALEANINEHLLLSFQEKMEAQMQQQQGQQGNTDPIAAAKMVAQVNAAKFQREQEQAKQAAEQNDAAMILAKADLLEAVTDSKKQEFEETYKTADLLLKKEKMEIDKYDKLLKAAIAGEKIDADTEKMILQEGLDAISKALEEYRKNQDSDEGDVDKQKE
jgi:hypothetical protein